MTDTVGVVQFGLGPIGCAVARHVVERAGVDLVGAVDIDASKVGLDAGRVIGPDRPLGFAVSDALAEVEALANADVVLHTTSSYWDLFEPQILEILEAGLSIVSTSEELSFPWLDRPGKAAMIDKAAKRAGQTVLATGINPGFLMDALPLALTAICQRVDRIAVTRVINATTRRGPFQAKIGSGLSAEEFDARMAAGRMGHVGLAESVAMVSQRLGRAIDRSETHVEPVIAEHSIDTEHVSVRPGQVRGLRQVVRTFSRDGEFMTLTFIAALDAEDEGDLVQITGHPDLEVRLAGTNGDLGTVAIVVNAIPRVLQAPPGLATMADLPMVTAW